MIRIYEVTVKGKRELFEESTMFEQKAVDEASAMEAVQTRLEAQGDLRANWPMTAVLKRER